jgi:hypothetical protein
LGLDRDEEKCKLISGYVIFLIKKKDEKLERNPPGLHFSHASFRKGTKRM